MTEDHLVYFKPFCSPKRARRMGMVCSGGSFLVKDTGRLAVMLIFMTAVLQVTFPLQAAEEPSESIRILTGGEGRPAITSKILGRVVEGANAAYTRMAGGGPSSVPLFSTWVSLVEYYHSRYLDLSSAARERAAGQVRDLLYHYKTKWDGFQSLFDDDNGLPSEVKTILLYRVAVHHTYRVLRGLGASSSNAGNPDFWDAYGRFVPHARSERYMTAYDIQSRAELQVSAARQNRLRRGFKTRYEDVSAAVANVQTAGLELERALDSYHSGRPLKGHILLDRAVRSFMEGSSSGAGLNEIQSVLDRFAEPFKSHRTVDGEKTFRDLLDASIDYQLQRVSGRFARDVTRELFSSVDRTGRSGTMPVGERVETVEVIGQHQKLNRDVFAMVQLETLVKEVAGEPVLENYQGLVAMAPRIFHGLLYRIVGEKKYEQLSSLYRKAHPEWTAGESERSYLESGSAVLTDSTIRRELRRSRKITEVGAQLRSIDSPELWWRGADVWARSARERWSSARQDHDPETRLSTLFEVLESWRTATTWYLHAVDRFPSEEIPSTLHLNIGACARNRFAFSNMARRFLAEQGVVSFDDVRRTRSESAFSPAEKSVARRILQPGSSERLGEIIENSYRAVITRGVSRMSGRSTSHMNEVYAQYVTALARLGAFEMQVHEAKSARHLFTILERNPDNGKQYYIRAVVKAGILHDDAGARMDYLKARALLRKERFKEKENAEIILTLGKIDAYLQRDPGANEE